ncbi:MAG: hypothetical protein U0S36_15465 [Candidatus Nanopelagicales bacterium]
MGSEISREEIDEALRERPSDCACERRTASMLMAATNRWGETVVPYCTWCLLVDRAAVGAIASWDGEHWDRREVGDGFVAAFLRDLPSERPDVPVPDLAVALAQFHRVTAMFRHRNDLHGWAAWVACVLNPHVPEGDVVAALEVVSAGDPSKAHWASAALTDWERLASYAAVDRARVVALHRAHLDGELAEIYGRNAAGALRRLGEDAVWPPAVVDA